MQCSKHPEHEAAGICAYSGKPYCAEELVEVSGKMYGKDNLSLVFSEAKELAAKQNNNVPMVFMNAGGAASSASSAASAAAASGYGTRPVGRRSKNTALILCCLGFLGFGGLHRFYTGHTAIGTIQLLTLGGGLIWQILDLLMILSGSYRDAEGHLLRA